MARSKNKSMEELANNSDANGSNAAETAPEMQEDEFVEQEVHRAFVDPTTKLMPTLPETFNSLLDFPINLTDKNPRNIITLLGNALGVDDYETNMASFWFLDVIALEILHFDSALDSRGKSLMVSWLAGEMQLIREKSLSHEAFLRHMQDIFDKSSSKISRGQPLLHWDSMMKKGNTEDIIAEEIVEKSKEPEVPQLPIEKHRLSSRSRDKKIRSKDRSRHSLKSLEKTKNYSEIIGSDQDKPKPEVESTKVLDIVKEATYDMYGDSFQYALFLAAFVEPVRLCDYKMPFTFRVPRPLKMFNVEKSTRGQDQAPSRKSKDSKKEMDDKKSKKNRDAKTMGIIQQESSVSMTDEEMLIKNRQYILPLMEAIEAASILETSKEIQAK